MTYKASNDARLAELYADNAKIRVRQIYPDGQERASDTSGDRWKMLIQAAAAARKSVPPDEESKFDAPQLEAQGEFIMVRAPRFSIKRCFRDDSYYQIHGRRSDGTWVIVQEFMSSTPVSYCDPGALRKKAR